MKSNGSSHLPLPTYVLLRLGAIPLSFLLNALFKTDSHSVLAVGSLTVATSSLVVTILHFTEQVTLGHLFLGLPVSVADALFPFLLWRASHDQSHKVPSQGSSPRDHVNVANASPLPHRIRTFWSTLRLIPLLSTAVLIPVFFLSGELQDIRRNCYILDITTLWHLLVASGIVNGVNLILLWLLATATSPVTMTFLAAPIYAFQLAVFTHSRSTLYSWADIGICWSFSMGFLALHMREGGLTAATRTIYSSLRNLHIAAVVLASVYLLLRVNRELFSSDDVEVSTIASCEMGFHPNSAMNLSEPTEVTNSVNDNYLGIRPDVDTVANLTLLVDRCSEVVDGTGVDDVVRCLSYLANTDEEYFSLPDAGPNYRASEQDFGKSEDIDGVSHVNALTKYLHLSGPKAASTKSIGKCDGPVYPYHVYWTGSASWRVELFIKAYLYTQNLPCSRLWLWLDSDLDPNAVDKMLCHDPIFSKFRPLVERGDIVLKRWNFPHRVPLVTESVESTGLSAIQSRTANTSNEKILADGTIQDVNGQQWLALHPTHTAFLPVQVSDAVRFIVLHQYGGVYLDMDVLMLRDMRPLLLPDPNTGNPSAFAEQWVERCNPGEYNTAIISLPANSSLSSYLLRGGVRMGMNFHPKMIGRMMWSDGRNDELKMLHNAVFDPLVTNLRREGTNTCTVPCHKNFKSAFMGTVEEAANEWSNYRGNKSLEVTDNAAQGNLGDALLPTNRTMENFFRGAWAYHIHNQVCHIRSTTQAELAGINC